MFSERSNPISVLKLLSFLSLFDEGTFRNFFIEYIRRMSLFARKTKKMNDHFDKVILLHQVQKYRKLLSNFLCDIFIRSSQQKKNLINIRARQAKTDEMITVPPVTPAKRIQDTQHHRDHRHHRQIFTLITSQHQGLSGLKSLM